MSLPTHFLVRSFQANDLAPLVAFWNNAFADRRNFYPITPADFERRILNCAAFDPHGLLLAWQVDLQREQAPKLVGIAHALRPAPKNDIYARWESRHNLALLYIDPAYRRQGVGSSLFRAAENWLYYCPVYVGEAAQPCYGTVEGPRPPFFGSSQQLGVSVHDRLLINFLTNRGYYITNPGSISMQLQLKPRPEPELPDLAALGLKLITVSHLDPFNGQEPKGREEYTLYGENQGDPYRGYLFVNGNNMLEAHISWYPMKQPGTAAIAGFWVAPLLRGHGIGRYLLDRTLYDLIHASQPWGGYDRVEVQTHLVQHATAAALYERRGFITEMAWVNLTKQCAVRGPQTRKESIGLSAY